MSGGWSHRLNAVNIRRAGEAGQAALRRGQKERQVRALADALGEKAPAGLHILDEQVLHYILLDMIERLEARRDGNGQ